MRILLGGTLAVAMSTLWTPPAGVEHAAVRVTGVDSVRCDQDVTVALELAAPAHDARPVAVAVRNARGELLGRTWVTGADADVAVQVPGWALGQPLVAELEVPGPDGVAVRGGRAAWSAPDCR